MDFNSIALLVLWSLLFNIISPASSYDSSIYLDKINQSNQLQQFYFPYYNQTIDLIDLVLNDDQRQTGALCDNSLQQLRNGLVKLEEWALKCKFDLFLQLSDYIYLDYTDMNPYNYLNYN